VVLFDEPRVTAPAKAARAHWLRASPMSKWLYRDVVGFDG
jgi:hypothetical protein